MLLNSLQINLTKTDAYQNMYKILHSFLSQTIQYGSKLSFINELRYWIPQKKVFRKNEVCLYRCEQLQPSTFFKLWNGKNKRTDELSETWTTNTSIAIIIVNKFQMMNILLVPFVNCKFPFSCFLNFTIMNRFWSIHLQVVKFYVITMKVSMCIFQK